MAPERLEPFTSSSNDAFLPDEPLWGVLRQPRPHGRRAVASLRANASAIWELNSDLLHAMQRLNAKLRAPVITHQQSNIPKQISRKVFYWTDTVVVKFLLVYQLCVYQLGFIKLTLRYLRIFDQNRTISWHLDQHDIERYSAIFHQSNNKSGGVLK